MEVGETNRGGRKKRYTKPILVYLDPELHDAGVRTAEREGVTFAALMRDLLRKYLRKRRSN